MQPAPRLPRGVVQVDQNVYAFGERVFARMFAAHPELAQLFPFRMSGQKAEGTVDEERVRKHIIGAFNALGGVIMGLSAPAETAAGLRKLIACAPALAALARGVRAAVMTVMACT